MNLQLVNFRETNKSSARTGYLQIIAFWRNQNFESLRSNPYFTPSDLQLKWFNKIIQDNTCQYYFVFHEIHFIGYCGLDKINFYDGTAEISLLIGTEYQNRGFGRQAVKKLLEHAFETFGLNCVFAEVYNTTTNSLFWEKCGFVREGVLRSRKKHLAKYYDIISMSVLRKEYATLDNI